jgi:LacI family transcriptional regulator
LIKHGLRTPDAARDAAQRMFRADPPEAIFTSQNLVTIGVLEALQDLGLRHKVALVAFDDIPLAGLLQPGLTVMAQDPAAIGRRAAERLFERINGDSSPPSVQTIPTRLIARGSGELPR